MGRKPTYSSSHFHQEIARDRHSRLPREARAAQSAELATDELEAKAMRRLLRLVGGRIGRRAVARGSLQPAT